MQVYAPVSSYRTLPMWSSLPLAVEKNRAQGGLLSWDLPPAFLSPTESIEVKSTASQQG